MSRALCLILIGAIIHWTHALLLAQTQEQLIAGAKKEGKLVIYASATAPQLQMYFTAFNKRYPNIRIQYVRSTGGGPHHNSGGIRRRRSRWPRSPRQPSRPGCRTSRG